eukprot:SAG22_NODE_529_length_9428_cov_2.691178_6_plen_502_part_00
MRFYRNSRISLEFGVGIPWVIEKTRRRWCASRICTRTQNHDLFTARQENCESRQAESWGILCGVSYVCAFQTLRLSDIFSEARANALHLMPAPGRHGADCGRGAGILIYPKKARTANRLTDRQAGRQTDRHTIQAMAEEAKTPVLLPATVVPTKYSICLDVDLVNFSFEGEQATDLTLAEATKEITLHSRELHIKTVSFLPAGADGAAKQEAVAINYNLAQQPGKSAFTATFVFQDELPAGAGVLSLTYTGCLNNQMAGFYRSGYTAIDGEKRVMASTQFEALDARRCFPCVDEPDAKAVFELSLVVVGDLTAFSNMPETNVTMQPPADGKPVKKKITFMPTPKMSTYLVAFCVGEFDFVQGGWDSCPIVRASRPPVQPAAPAEPSRVLSCRSDRDCLSFSRSLARSRARAPCPAARATTGYTDHGVQVRVYTPPGKSATGEFSLQVAKDSLDLYDDFFQMPYPLPKLDMVAIPEFAMGAMENWGLVTYREVDLVSACVKL